MLFVKGICVILYTYLLHAFCTLRLCENPLNDNNTDHTTIDKLEMYAFSF